MSVQRHTLIQKWYKCHVGGQEGKWVLLTTTEDTSYWMRAAASCSGNRNMLLLIWRNQSGPDSSTDHLRPSISNCLSNKREGQGTGQEKRGPASWLGDTVDAQGLTIHLCSGSGPQPRSSASGHIRTQQLGTQGTG